MSINHLVVVPIDARDWSNTPSQKAFIMFDYCKFLCFEIVHFNRLIWICTWIQINKFIWFINWDHYLWNSPCLSFPKNLDYIWRVYVIENTKPFFLMSQVFCFWNPFLKHKWVKPFLKKTINDHQLAVWDSIRLKTMDTPPSLIDWNRKKNPVLRPVSKNES